VGRWESYRRSRDERAPPEGEPRWQRLVVRGRGWPTVLPQEGILRLARRVERQRPGGALQARLESRLRSPETRAARRLPLPVVAAGPPRRGVARADSERDEAPTPAVGHAGRAEAVGADAPSAPGSRSAPEPGAPSSEPAGTAAPARPAVHRYAAAPVRPADRPARGELRLPLVTPLGRPRLQREAVGPEAPQAPFGRVEFPVSAPRLPGALPSAPGGEVGPEPVVAATPAPPTSFASPPRLRAASPRGRALSASGRDDDPLAVLAPAPAGAPAAGPRMPTAAAPSPPLDRDLGPGRSSVPATGSPLLRPQALAPILATPGAARPGLVQRQAEGASLAAPPSAPSLPTYEPSPSPPAVDVVRIADEVYALLARRLAAERERRGA
jgi:hypothetical protein